MVSKIKLDTNRAVFHQNFNMEARAKLLSDYAEDVSLVKEMPREEWFVLKGSDKVQIKETAKQYGLEELSDYRQRSMEAMDAMRKKQIETRLGKNL